MEKSRQIFKRVLALAALVLAVAAIFVIVGDNTGSDNGDGSNKSGKNNASKQKPKTGKKVYVIKEGDTLTAIAVSTGISVEKIQRLNPDLDPQVLISGQSLKLR